MSLQRNLVLTKQVLLVRQLYYYLLLFPKFINFGVLKQYSIQLHVKQKYAELVFQLLELHWYSQYKTLVDLVGLDFLVKANRFSVYYMLLSYKYNTRLDVILTTNSVHQLLSVVHIYAGALWLEREVWDLFGIYFQQNPDLRRILTDYGFLGYPLRKDFPLSGFSEVSYDDRKKSIIYKKNSFAQEVRNFYKISTWR
jgi:NADH dehydrogenase (ubiquinone) Fe-S protein 3